MTPLLDSRMDDAEAVSDVGRAHGVTGHAVIMECRPRVDKCRPRGDTRNMRNGVAAPTTIGPFEVLETEGFTQCECYVQPCRHAPDFYRPYYSWIVWDTEAQEHAFITRGSAFDNEYERKRDAVAAVRLYLGKEQ